MKIWVGYGSEHSSNLVIIGTFDTADKAREAQDLLRELTSIAASEEKAGTLKLDGSNIDFPQSLLEFFVKKELLTVSANDAVQLLFENKLRIERNMLIVTTEEYDVNAFVKVMLNGGAKVEVFSAHDHRSSYGRST